MESPTTSSVEPVRKESPSVRGPNGRAPAEPSRWQRVRFVLRAIEVRLRFVGLFVAVGLLMAYWESIENYWDRWTRPAASERSIEPDTEFYCPMHPSVVRSGLEPDGSIPSCPICGMPLSQRKKGTAVPLPPGVQARVQLSPERIRLAGIETVPVAYQPLVKEVRTVGSVTYDETRLAVLVTRVSGYLERLYVDATYTTVREGEPLAEIYSPELYSSAQELRLGRKYQSEEIVASARKRLELLGISDPEIEEILRAENLRARLQIRSPLAGQVIKKNVVAGAAVEAGQVLFEVADLSTVWVEAEVFERELGYLQVGDRAEAHVAAFPGKAFTGTISLIYPEVDTQTRTGRVRITLDNSEGSLRPGMYVTAVIRKPLSETEPYRTRLAARTVSGEGVAAQAGVGETCPVSGLKLGTMGPPVSVQLGEQLVRLCCNKCRDDLQADPQRYLALLAPPPEDTVLAVPASAVIDTGTRQIVYVEREAGLFEGVQVQLGGRVGGAYPVLEGLAAGDRVAAAGSFLIDAETHLHSAAASTYFGASGHGPASEDGAPRSGAGHVH